MNKIIITDNNIESSIDENINVEKGFDNIIKNISIDILNNTNLELEYNILDELKIDVNINILANVSCNIVDRKKGFNIKSKYHYNLGEESNLILNKINDGEKIREYDVFDLNGEYATVNYSLKTVSNTKEVYDIVVNHNKENTNSNVYTSGINILDGLLNINVTGYVPKGSFGASVNQVNRIINLTNNNCEICPNLLIDEMNSEANHSAHISNFSDEDLFYLKLRGIGEVDATRLLVKGLLMSNTLDKSKEYINEIMDKYWR